MSLLWAVPPVAMAVATAIALQHLRRIETATADLREQLQRLGEVGAAVAAVRSAMAETRARARSLRR